MASEVGDTYIGSHLTLMLLYSFIQPVTWYSFICVPPLEAPEHPSSTSFTNICISLLCSLASFRKAACENESDIKFRIEFLNPSVLESISVVPNSLGFNDDPAFFLFDVEVWRVRVLCRGEDVVDLSFFRFVEPDDFLFPEELAINSLQFALVIFYHVSYLGIVETYLLHTLTYVTTYPPLP